MIQNILMFIGYFDWLIIAAFIFLNIKFWHSGKQISNILGFLPLPLFGLILPIFSIAIELELNGTGGNDNFNILYVYFRFPLYWVLLIIQYIILKKRN